MRLVLREFFHADYCLSRDPKTSVFSIWADPKHQTVEVSHLPEFGVDFDAKVFMWMTNLSDTAVIVRSFGDKPLLDFVDFVRANFKEI
jgi:hypothetical protein